MLFCVTDIPDHKIMEKIELLEGQRREYLSRFLRAMVEEQEEWLPKGFKADSLFLIWRTHGPLVDDPRVFASIRAERSFTLPEPKWGSTLYEYINAENRTNIVWSLPREVIVKSNAFRALDWDDVSRRSINEYRSGQLKKYVLQRNKEIIAKNIAIFEGNNEL
jgi:hypothetical protein